MAGARSFPSRLRHIQDGEPVSAGVAGRPNQDLEGRTAYLKEVVDSIEAGRALVLRDQPVKSDVLEQQPVYWNSANQQYEQALAAVENDEATQMLATAESADVVGLVLTKKVGNVADIVIWGVVQFESLANTIDDETIEPGRYYLSPAAPGKLVKQRPAATVAVCIVFGPLDSCDQNTWVFVMPQMRDFLEDHIHYQFDLVPRPAGTHVPPMMGERHVITDADTDKQGWLPADHAIFDGKAPAGAQFGYNLSAHSGLDKVFPPIPATSYVVEMMHSSNLGTNATSFEGLERVPPEQVIIDVNGIWWMTDCYNEVPWPTELDTTLSSSSSSSSAASPPSSSSSLSSSSAEELTVCPTPRDMRIILSFIKMTFMTNKTVVTSLQPDEGQPLSFVSCDGEEANTGDLFARLVLNLLVEEGALGGQALKNITSDNKFSRGYVTEGMIAGSEQVTLSGSQTRLLDPDEDFNASTNPVVHQGIVTVDIQVDPTERELLPQLSILGDAVERTYKRIAYLGFPTGRDSEVRAKFVVPPAGLPLNPKLKIRAQLFGRGVGTLTDLGTTYYISARPETGSPTSITDADVSLVMDTDVAVNADEIHELESDQIDISPGDTVFVSLIREADGSPTYDFEIGLVRLGAVIEAG